MPRMMLTAIAAGLVWFGAARDACAGESMRIITGCENIPMIAGVERGVDVGLPAENLMTADPKPRHTERWRAWKADARRLMREQGRCFVFWRGQERGVSVDAAWAERNADGQWRINADSYERRAALHRQIADLAAASDWLTDELPEGIAFGMYAQRAGRWGRWMPLAEFQADRIMRPAGIGGNHYWVLPDPIKDQHHEAWRDQYEHYLQWCEYLSQYAPVIITVQVIDYDRTTPVQPWELALTLQVCEVLHTRGVIEGVYLDNASDRFYRFREGHPAFEGETFTAEHATVIRRYAR